MKKNDLQKDPLDQFKLWYQEASDSNEYDVDAMTLATSDTKGHVSARTVLYKGISVGGFLIFTNYNSDKAQHLISNPQAALVFYWPTLYKQVRIEGLTQKITSKESDDYFKTRSYERKLSAWASPQSQVIVDSEDLLARYAQLNSKFTPETIFCPPFWGGFRLVPNRMEFWIGKDHRLHDRFSYIKTNNNWIIQQVAP